VLCGFGFGNFVFGLIAISLLNPDTVEVDPLTTEYTWDIAKNVPSTLQVLSGIFFLIAVISIVLIHPAPSLNQNYVDIER
jgi:hypothetical protein